MGITFVHINDTQAEDLKSLSVIANMAKEKGLRDNDELWEKLILRYIALLYQNFTLQGKQFLCTADEKTIKDGYP